MTGGMRLGIRIARPKCLAVNGMTALSMAPSRTCRCQSSGLRMVIRVVMSDLAAGRAVTPAQPIVAAVTALGFRGDASRAPWSRIPVARFRAARRDWADPDGRILVVRQLYQNQNFFQILDTPAFQRKAVHTTKIPLARTMSSRSASASPGPPL